MTAKMNQPNYTNCLTFTQMEKDLNLFDDIPHKWTRIYHEDDDIEVQIICLECDRVGWCKTLFKFQLSLIIGIKQEFEVVLEYSDCGFYALYIMELELCACCDQPINGADSDEMNGLKVCIDCYKEDESDSDESELVISDDSDDDDDDDDWKYLCPNSHWGGQYGCDLCMDCADSKNSNMEKAWLKSDGKYCYKLHKKWLEDYKN